MNSQTPETPRSEDEVGPAREPASGLKGRFPVLRALERVSRRRVPFIQQLSMTDCGPACLAMVLGYYGKNVGLDPPRRAIGISRDGSSARAILDGARAFGLRGRAVKVDLEGMPYLPEASILHWEFRHFVVFERLGERTVRIVDPATGPRDVPIEQFRKSFTGVAVVLEPDETFEAGGEERKRGVLRYLQRLAAQSGLFARVVAVSILLRLLALALPVTTGLLIDRVIPRSDYALFQVVAIGLGVLLLFTFVGTLVRAHLNLHLRTHLDAEMTLDFVHHLVGLPYEYFQLRSPGDLIVRLNSNAQIRDILTTGVLSTLLDGSLACIYLGLLFAVTPKLAAIALAIASARVVVLVVTRRRQRELQARNLGVQARAQSYQFEMLNGMETLKVLGAEQRGAEHWANVYVESLNVDLARGRLNAAVDSLMATFDSASPLIILAVGAQSVMAGSFTLGTMLAMNSLAIAFLAPLGNLVSSLTGLQLLGTYLERVEEVLETPLEQGGGQDRLPAPTLRGDIRLEHVSFAYGPNAPLVVRDVSLSVRAGQSVAIVGKSGSGKTTLGRLLAGLYRPSAGKIYFDEQDLEGLDHRSVRRQLGVVTQRPYLFTGSIRSNIALGRPDARLDQVQAAAKLASVHDDIVAMPLGYETPLPSDGGSLSGGQKQRIAIARALLDRPPVMLLDEATSSLDTVTERKVQRALEAMRSTRIVIAHRLSTVANADLIVVLDEGRIVEQGTHAELVRNGGLYAKLVASQLASSEAPN